MLSTPWRWIAIVSLSMVLGWPRTARYWGAICTSPERLAAGRRHSGQAAGFEHGPFGEQPGQAW